MAREYCNRAVEVGTVQTLICTVGQGVSQCTLQNVSDRDIYVGGAEVTIDGETRGFMLRPGEWIQLESYEDDSSELYGVIAEATETKTSKPTKTKDDDESPTATIVFLVSS